VKIGTREVEQTTVVEMGSTAGQTHGWECVTCQQVTGLAFASYGEANASLSAHLSEHLAS